MLKSDLRKTYLSRRKQISETELSKKSQQIADLFFERFDLNKISVIHIFLPIIEKNEINTFLIINRIKSEFPHIRIAVPKSIPETSEMESYLFEDEYKLVRNSWKIPEPFPHPEHFIPEYEISMVLVPLLIFDQQGNRVGYGKGFYDRFLARCTKDCKKVGICLESPILEIEDPNQFDIKLEYCITPEKVFSF